MPRPPEQAYDAKQPIARGIASAVPNSSTPITVQAIGVLVAPANAPTNPTAAPTAGSSPMAGARADPAVAPTTNSGVTSPPTKPVPRHTAVKTILRTGTVHDVWPPAS